MRILPANSEGFWIPIFVSWFLSFFGFPVLLCICFAILISLCVCHFVVFIVCYFVVIIFVIVRYICVILLGMFVVFLRFSCRFLIRRGWLYLEPTWKVQKTSLFWRHANHFFGNIVCHLPFVLLHCYVVLLPFLHLPDWE